MSVQEFYISAVMSLVSSDPSRNPYTLTARQIWDHAASSSGPLHQFPEDYSDFFDRGGDYLNEIVTWSLERISSTSSYINAEKVVSSLSLKLIETASGEALKVELTPGGEETLTDYVTPGRFTVELTPEKLSLTRVRSIKIDKVVVNRSEPSQ